MGEEDGSGALQPKWEWPVGLTVLDAIATAPAQTAPPYSATAVSAAASAAASARSAAAAASSAVTAPAAPSSSAAAEAAFQSPTADPAQQDPPPAAPGSGQPSEGIAAESASFHLLEKGLAELPVGFAVRFLDFSDGVT